MGWTLEIVKHWWTGVRWVWVGASQAPPTIPRGFPVLPRRWVVERTFAWLLKPFQTASQLDFIHLRRITEGVGQAIEQCAGDCHHVGCRRGHVTMGRGPQVLAHHGDGLGKGRQ